MNIDRRSTKSDFKQIQDRINNKLAGWKARTLSQADEMVIIKSNLSSIPMYTIYVKILNYITKELDSKKQEVFRNNNLSSKKNLFKTPLIA